jgi:Xaa-Pro aminopeptidase
MRRPSRRELLSGAAGLAAAGSLGCAAAGAAGADETARLDERLAGLEDQSGSVEPITPAERAARRARCGKLLAEAGADALLMEGGATMTYLTGVAWGHSERLFGLVVLADGGHFWICPSFEVSRAALAIDAEDGPGGEIVAWDEHEYAFAPLAGALRERGVDRVAIEPELRYVFVDGLARELGASRVVSGRGVVAALRSVKDAHELLLLRRANELTQLAIRTVAGLVEPGTVDTEVGRLLDRAHERLGMTHPWRLALVGPDAALPHGGLSERRIGAGDVLLTDTGAALHGYHSDITRTWVVGAPPPETVVRIWNVVRDAQRRAFEALRPGAPCADADRAARAVIDAAGYGPGYRTFTHRLGHGIGLEGHEDPYLDGGSRVVLEPGMTFSDEPGIYLPGELGVRLEDIVAITAGGAEVFGSWQRSPASPA